MRPLSDKEREDLEKLFLKHEKQIDGMVKSMSKICHIPAEDLKQEAFFGLVKAYSMYNESKASFFTYAKYWIRLMIYTYACNHQHIFAVPADYFSIYTKIKTMRDSGMSTSAIAEELGISEKRLNKVLESMNQARKVCSNNEIFDSELEEGEVVSNTEFLETKIGNDDFVKKIKTMVTPHEFFVLDHLFALRCSQPKTLSWVGKIMGVTRERVRQIRNTALDKIRQGLLAEINDYDA